MNLNPREAKARMEAGYKLYEQGYTTPQICDALGVSTPTVTRWRKRWSVPKPEKVPALTLDPTAMSVDDQIKALSLEAMNQIRTHVHSEDARVSLSACLQVLALAGHVPPARKPSVQPSDGASRRGSAIARLSAGVTPDEGRAPDVPPANATGAPGTDCVLGDTMTP